MGNLLIKRAKNKNSKIKAEANKNKITAEQNKAKTDRYR